VTTNPTFLFRELPIIEKAWKNNSWITLSPCYTVDIEEREQRLEIRGSEKTVRLGVEFTLIWRRERLSRP
jgi:hypothetical protein